MCLLKLENLSKQYGEFWAVKDFSLAIGRGDFFGLLGANGAGKTTILRLIAGLETLTTGKITFNDCDVATLSTETVNFAVISQTAPALANLNVFANVAANLKNRSLSEKETEKKVFKALELTRLESFANRRVDELSGGEQQLVRIASAIALEPQLLLFDEPLSNLDRSEREQILGELRALIKTRGVAAIYVTQNQDEAFAFCDRIGVMADGQLRQTGAPRELYNQPNSKFVAGFLGRNNLIQAARRASSQSTLSEFETLTGEHRLFVDQSANESLGALGQTVTLAIRPENVVLAFGAAFPEDNLLKAVVVSVQYFGATTRIVLDAGGLPIETMVLRLVGLKVGDECMISLPPNRIAVLKD